MAKADKALSARRVHEILCIRLDGAQWWDVLQFVREKEREEGSAWFVPQGAKPLSEAMIRKYQQRADALMLQAHGKSRQRLIRRHLAQRRHLYGKAVLAGEIDTALRVLQDEAKLAGLYPKPEDDLRKELAELRKMLEEAKAADGDGDGGTEG
jgi:hypothetical protein